MLVVSFGLSIAASAVAVADLPEGFVDDVVFTNLVRPTNIEFASDGRVFVAEERGTIQVFPSIENNTRTQFADLRDDVHYHWDRGLLGMALHPDFPTQPYVYVLYTYKRPLQYPALPEWPGSQCGDPPGTTKDGCVVSGRLSRLTASGSQMVPGSEVVLITDWCQQFPSHSIGDLVFGDDGALYVSAGDGAAFHRADWGQLGGTQGDPPITPVNPCEDPDDLGGALRSQNPDELDGTVIRIAPQSLVGGTPGNPSYEVVAYGLRNPFRMTMQPGTGELFIGDVGWGQWEEVNVHPDPTSDTVHNFGWPCYEGGNGASLPVGSYSSRPVCQSLSSADVTPSLFAYQHGQGINGDTSCPLNSGSATTGLAFNQGGEFPEEYAGALFGADYSRNCIWVMFNNGAGNLDPATVKVFQDFAPSPVDLEIGPNGDLYYPSFWGSTVRRIRYKAPNAVVAANPLSGPAPLTVEFDGSASHVPSPFTIDTYEWDFTGDGLWVVGGVIEEHEYEVPGSYTAWLRVTDSKGDSATDSISIQVANTPPVATIGSPSPDLPWRVGDVVAFSGSGWDQQDGDLPPSAMTWEVILHHAGHQHHVETFEGVDSGSFSAPDHEFPSHLEIRLTVEDSFGATDTEMVELFPETVALTFETDPSGLDVTFFDSTLPTPFTRTWILGATVDISTETLQEMGGSHWLFQEWAHGGDLSQTFPAPDEVTTYTARFEEAGPPVAVIGAAPLWGDAPLTVELDGSGSTVVEPFTIDIYEWDFTGDGLWVVGGVIEEHEYEVPGSYTAWLRVTDSKGDSATDSISIQVANTPPVATIGSPSPDLPWRVGDVIAFSGSGWDQQDGDLPPSAMTWEVILHHAGHQHHVETFEGVDSGSFNAPDHEFPSHLEIRSTVEDSEGATDTASVVLQPEVVELTFNTDPSGLSLSINGTTGTAPITRTLIMGATVDISTEPLQEMGGSHWLFQEWAHGGDLSQTFPAPATNTTYTATFQRVNQPPVANAGPDRSVTVGETAVLDGTGSFDPDGDSLTYQWSIQSRPDGSSAGLVGATTTKPTLTPDRAGTYTIRLRVSDGTVNAFDQVRVLANEVLDAGEDPPPSPPSSSGGDFTDAGGSIFETEIEWLATQGITRGCNPPANTRFCPDDFVTRGQMAAFFARAFKWTDAGGVGLFVDATDSTFGHDIDLMGTAGVTRGCNPPANDRFCPDDFVTRGQMAAFFARAFGWSDTGSGGFVDATGSTFRHEIDLMGTAGVTRGCNPPANDRFCPDDFVTRGQMAAFFHRAWKTLDG